MAGVRVAADPCCHLLQRVQLAVLDQVELGDEVVEVLVAGVHVRLLRVVGRTESLIWDSLLILKIGLSMNKR